MDVDAKIKPGQKKAEVAIMKDKLIISTKSKLDDEKIADEVGKLMSGYLGIDIEKIKVTLKGGVAKIKVQGK